MEVLKDLIKYRNHKKVDVIDKFDQKCIKEEIKFRLKNKIFNTIDAYKVEFKFTTKIYFENSNSQKEEVKSQEKPPEEPLSGLSKLKSPRSVA